MFGHCDAPAHWAAHLVALRDLQKRTHGITEFVPLPFVHMEAPIYRRGGTCPALNAVRRTRGLTCVPCFCLQGGRAPAPLSASAS